MNTIPLRETDLVAAATAGDESAFDSLIGPLVEPGYKLAVVILRDSTEAQDAVQDACFKAWKKLDQLRSDSPLRPWFLTIVANHCRSLRRSRWWSVASFASVDRVVDFEVSTVESDLDLNHALTELPTTDRAVLFLFFNLDLPLAEVAKILKISPHAAKSRVHRAVAKLRINMAEVPE